MSMSISSISFCGGVYNEEKIVLSKLEEIKNNLDKIIGKNNYEIILVENGSVDKTAELLRRVKDKNTKILFANEKGHGLALKMAIQNAKYNNIVLTGIDLPFGFKDLKDAAKIWEDYDIIFGSKAHPKSRIVNTFQRRINSWTYRFLLKIFFKLNIKDPQGSVFLKKDKIKPLLKYCTEKNAFFTTQIAIYGKLFNLKMIEIPVEMKKEKNRKSSYKIIKDGRQILLSMIKEYRKIKRIKNI